MSKWTNKWDLYGASLGNRILSIHKSKRFMQEMAIAERGYGKSMYHLQTMAYVYYLLINKSETAKLARDQVLIDGRKVSRLVVDAEDKLGELLETTVKERGETIKGGSSQRTKLPTLPLGINKKESHYAQEIHRHPEIVNQIWNEKKNVIHTRHDVLKRIQYTLKKV